MQELVFATHNEHKVAELKEMLAGHYQLLSLTDIGCHEDIPETADTLEGNAILKAQYVWEHYDRACFADDTGLEVAALDGAPGVYSARYAGRERSSEANMQKLLHELSDKEDRSARFRTAIALINEKGTQVFEGIVNGEILHEKKGEKGFGYDPLFQPEGESLSFAEMPGKAKNAISHRGRAVHKLVEFLKGE